MHGFRGSMGSIPTIEDELRLILFEIGKNIKIHRIDKDNTIIDVDYEKHVAAILDLFDKYQSSM